ncbi:MAG: heat-inducible transcription repressor HrcA [Clostridia bacterium]|nr:heat-inducible transcription repressor HrcA [Clostridia bacterium]
MSDFDENLSERKKLILFSSVEDYIQSAVPITSKGVQENYLKDISTATLRNELNALEAMGYLKQLHTSSGRVPTTKAYRIYVNNLMQNLNFNVQDLDEVTSGFHRKFNNLTSIIDTVAKTISKVTNCPTVAVLNDLKKLNIEDIQIIPLIDFTALMLLQTNGGIINNTFEISENVTKEDCINCAIMLKNKFVGKSINEMIESIENTTKEENERLSAFKEIFESVVQLLKDASTPVQKGRTKLLSMPEYKTIEKAKEIIDLLEDEEKVRNLLAPSEDEEISVTIGREFGTEELEDCAVVKAPIKIGNSTVASVGVIGPKRLDYGLVAGAISYVVNELKNIHQIENKEDN